MELSEIIPHIEVLIFASEKPLTNLDIVELINNTFGFMEERITLDQVESCMEGIREKYQSEFYPFEVRESGGGWQFLTKRDYHKTIAQLNGDKFLKRLSNAALETLAIIAYKAPITKGEIESIRGVNSDYSIQKLLEKELIIITGRSENLPGKPLVYATSKSFMDYFGLNSVADLPKIKEVLADIMIEPTQVSGVTETGKPEEEKAPLAVDSNGDLIAHDAAIAEAAAETNSEETAAAQDEPDAAQDVQDAALDAAAATAAYNLITEEQESGDQDEIDAALDAAAATEAYDQLAEEAEETAFTSEEEDIPSKQDEDETPFADDEAADEKPAEE
ncbi:SMC-Scp complex subunit ScpB [Deminuibacter soli]|uniref:SMC-Scp complex subunit ScpB n=1 Tax=Deminuibacter soli TaxID=2291815 RepID=A0A3E1NNL4_9BACT|nr:SMC-Scp complex subunit ScpB [Deminuibacter soli]RFM29510.1 SMC-Scp complex subunit ScpB [Deminuibacter soli]